jgi:ABC-type glycerol-3-phosphate transport system permease component
VRHKRRRSPLRKSPIHRATLIVIGVVLTVFTLFPIYWMLVTAFRTPGAVLRSKSLLPGPWSLDGIETLFAITPFMTYLLNSIIVSVTVTVANLAIVTPVAYLVSKMSGRLRRAVTFSVLLGYMFPEVLVVLPVYVVLVNINLDNSILGLVLGILSIALPLGLWLLTAFMKSIPREVEEAALVDGASWIQVFWRVIVPLSRPGIITVAIFSFIAAWADYVFALTIIRSESSKTLPVGLASLYGDLDASWNVIMAGAILISIPVMAVVMFASRYFVSGLTLGATKG